MKNVMTTFYTECQLMIIFHVSFILKFVVVTIYIFTKILHHITVTFTDTISYYSMLLYVLLVFRIAFWQTFTWITLKRNMLYYTTEIFIYHRYFDDLFGVWKGELNGPDDFVTYSTLLIVIFSLH